MPGAKPYSLANTMLHPLARMLPIQRLQAQVYRLGERLPPSGGLFDHSPTWEAVNLVLTAGATLQARVNVQRDFTLLAIMASSSSQVNGGFRAQFFDTKKELRFMERNAAQNLIAGSVFGAGTLTDPFFLREPYEFDQADSQILVSAQNLETVTNIIQIVFYGVALRFNQASPTQPDFPGGLVASAGGE
jgi:hypothetical protein